MTDEPGFREETRSTVTYEELTPQQKEYVDGRHPQTATYKATEQYLDDEDRGELEDVLDAILDPDATYVPRYRVQVDSLLKALEDLRNHLRGKYYGG